MSNIKHFKLFIGGLFLMGSGLMFFGMGNYSFINPMTTADAIVSLRDTFIIMEVVRE